MKKAQPIWIKGKGQTLNCHAVFTAEVPAGEGLCLHIASTAFYRIFLNEEFIAFGPARTARGYLREDVLPLGREGGRLLIEACGYYCKSLSTECQPSLLMAEVCKGEEVLLCTGADFKGYFPKSRRQKCERYSIQRHFTEIWDYDLAPELLENPMELEGSDYEVSLLPRRVPAALYEDIDLLKAAWRGEFSFDESRPYRTLRYSWKKVPKEWGIYEEEELSDQPFRWVWRQKQVVTERDCTLPLNLSEGEYALFDFGRIEAGFFKTLYESLADSTLVIAFGELFEGEEFSFGSLSGHHVVEVHTAKGDLRDFMTFEPYTMRYCLVMVKKGCIRLKSAGCKTYMFDARGVMIPEGSETLQGICRAAVRTFAHNAVDLYTDCPSRERAGWLCDSYFTARAEYAITGKTAVEDAFLENYRLFKNDGSYPEGALPDCYPSDIQPAEPFIPMGIFPPSGPKPGEVVFIPQWTMWYILEVEEYLLLRGHEEMKEQFRPSIYGLLNFYRRHKNEDGLLEDLPSWNFVEWSKANDWVRNVNYPTNFLYAAVLDAIDHLYGDESCRKEAEEIRQVAIKQSFNGEYFFDHSIRNVDGKRLLQQDASEACQYYAVLFAGIDMEKEEYAPLKRLILEVFSPKRGEDTRPEIFPVNAFIGAYLRMDALLKLGAYELLLSDVEGFFGHMSALTGTLWEYREWDKGSHDHGFAAYVYAAVKKALKSLENR